jgi:hypothetical protein
MKAKLAQVRKVSLVLGTLSLVATLLAGCDDGGGEFGNCYFISDETSSISAPQTAVVFAPTSNFVDFSSIIGRAATPVKESLGADLLSSQKKESIGRELSLVLADGDPQLVSRRAVTVAEGFTTDLDIDRAVKAVFGNFDLAASCAAGDLKIPGKDEVPTTEQTDLLKALAIAKDQLTTEKARTIFVLGNGIQTSGAIHMQDSDTFPKNDSSAKRLAKALFQRGEIPDLNGVMVNWYGLGQVDGEFQKPLPLASVAALETFWRESIKLAGGTVGEICSQCGSGSPNKNAIVVDPVGIKECPLTVKLYESDGVEFKANSSSFVSPSKAQTAAIKTVKQFKAQGCSSLTVIGFAAAGKDKKVYLKSKAKIDKTNKSLTANRARAFGALLEDAGFTGDLQYVGGGTCGTEWNPDGKAVPDLQRLCRRVEVTN